MGPAAPFGALVLHLGGSIALHGADWLGFDGSLVLCEPTVSSERYGQEILRANLTVQMAAHGKVQVNREQLPQALQAGDVLDVEGYGVRSHPSQGAAVVGHKEVTSCNSWYQAERLVHGQKRMFGL